MLLKPASMQRIAVIGSKDERQRVASILYDLGVVQIEPVSDSALPYLRTELDSTNMREVSEELLRIRALRTALPRDQGFGEDGLFLAEGTSRSFTFYQN